MTDRPDVSARGLVEVFEAHRVLAWHDEKMARCDGIQVHEHHDGLVLVHHTGLGLPGRNGAEDAPPCRRWRVLCHVRHRPSATGTGPEDRDSDGRTPARPGMGAAAATCTRGPGCRPDTRQPAVAATSVSTKATTMTATRT